MSSADFLIIGTIAVYLIAMVLIGVYFWAQGQRGEFP